MKRTVLGVIVIIIVVAAGILLTPVILASSFTVPVSKITFSELTGSLTHGNANATTSSVTVYEYYFLTRSGGVVRTTDTNVNSTKGFANVTISMLLTTPANTTIDLGKTTISGGVGNRTHTVYLSIDQGLRASGMYRLTVSIDASIKLATATSASSLASGFETTWKVP